MKYILLTLAMALIAVITSCGHGKVDLPSGDTGTDTVGIKEAVDIDTTVKDTTDTEDTTAEVTTVSESTESSDISETPYTSVDNYDIQTIIDENLDILSSAPSSRFERDKFTGYFFAPIVDALTDDRTI